MHSLLHLRVVEALDFNVLLFVALGLFLILANVIAKELIGPRYPFPQISISAKVGWSLVAFVFVFWIVRNIPSWPFTILAP